MRTDLTERRPVRAERLAMLGITLVTIFVACCIAMHFIQPELSPNDDAVSYYMNGRLGWALGLGLVALGVGSLCIMRSLALLLEPGETPLGLWLLALWGVCAAIGGVFPPDPRGHWDRPPSFSGMIHGGVAIMAFLAFPAAAWLLSWRIAKFPAKFGPVLHLKVLALLSTASLCVFLVCLAPAFVNRAPQALGLIERLLLIFYTAWLIGAGLAVLAAMKRNL